MGGSSKPCKKYNDNGTGNGKGNVKAQCNEKDKKKMAGKMTSRYLPAGLEMKMAATKKTREAASQR